MILSKMGAEFEYEGVKYVVGQPVVATAESEYEGLHGTITEIRDGEDKETDNETPDIYCEFEPPEVVFSDLYDEPKELEDIILDLVIMAPGMVRPLEVPNRCLKNMDVFVVMEDWAVDGEHGNDCELFLDSDDAKRTMYEKIREELVDGAITQWAEKENFTVYSSADSYEAYLDGEYLMNHYAISLCRQPLKMSVRSIKQILALAAEYSPEREPLLEFIKEEVPFRLREVFTWLPDSAVTEDVIAACVNALWSDTNVMFAYDAMDDVIAEELSKLGLTPNRFQEGEEK